MSRLWNRKNERKHRKRRLRLAKLGGKKYRYWGYIAEGREGKEYIKYSRNGWVRDMKRATRRKVRQEDEVPDGNGYRKYEDRWKYD